MPEVGGVKGKEAFFVEKRNLSSYKLKMKCLRMTSQVFIPMMYILFVIYFTLYGYSVY